MIMEGTVAMHKRRKATSSNLSDYFGKVCPTALHDFTFILLMYL